MGEKNKNISMEEISVVMRKFGDEQSNLLDQFERVSFELQLNQAILGRSLSEPGVGRYGFRAPVAPLVTTTQVKQGRRGRGGGSGFGKLLKKLLKLPILTRKGENKKNGGGRKEMPDAKNPLFLKDFSRSLRF